MKVYTGAGDKGQTSLVGGSKVKKSDNRVDLYGQIDELNSWVGLLQSSLQEKDELLYSIQNLLFELGSYVACEEEKRAEFKLYQIQEDDYVVLEAAMDEMNKDLAGLKNFILPGGSRQASLAHMCRVYTRSLERSASDSGLLNQEGLIWLNRLSDYFFVLARMLNKKNNVSDIEWSKKK